MSERREETRFVSVITALVDGAEAAIDLMRYERCYPADEGQSHALIRIMHGHAVPGDDVVRFEAACQSDRDPDEARWRSYGCRVLDVRRPDDPPPNPAEIAAAAAAARAQLRPEPSAAAPAHDARGPVDPLGPRGEQ